MNYTIDDAVEQIGWNSTITTKVKKKMSWIVYRSPEIKNFLNKKTGYISKI